MANEPIHDVIIIGAGFTGLCAARELEKLGAGFVVLESFTDHVGGRAYSYDPQTRPGTPLRYDHGAEYVGDLQNEIMDIIRQELPADALVNGAHLRHPYPYQVMVLAGERHRFKLDDSLFGITGIPPDLGIAAVLGVVGLLAELTLIEIQIDTLEPWKGPKHLLELDQVSVWDWLNDKDWLVPSVKDLLRISIEALLSVEPSEISPYYLLWYCACNSGIVNETNDDAGGPQQYWLSCGADAVAEKIATPIRDRIRMGVSVTGIDLSSDTVSVTTEAGETLRAKKVLVAMSPHTAGRIRYTPAPSASRRALMDQPMGRTLKCQIFYKSQWWREDGYNGYCGGANHPVLWVMDNSPPPGVEDGTYVLMSFTVGTKLDELGYDASQQKIVEWVTTTVRNFFQDDRALWTSDQFVKLVPHYWTKEGPIGGGPNTVFSIGALTGEAGKMLDEHWDDKVFFASAENAKKLDPVSKSPRWNLLNPDNMPKYTDDGLLLLNPAPPYRSNYSDYRDCLGYMDGAISSGRYVAHEIAQSLGLANKLTPLARRPDPGPIASPAPAPEADEVSVFDRVRAAIEKVTPDEMRPWIHRPSGPRGFASWFQQQLLGALDADGDGEPDDPVRKLTKVRDFAIRASSKLRKDDDPKSSDGKRGLKQAVADADATLRKKLGL